jgi:hypothetical protein
MKKIHLASDRSPTVKKLKEEGAWFCNHHKSVSAKVTRNFTGEKALDYVTETHAIYYFSKNKVWIYICERNVLQLQHAILAKHSCFLRHIHLQKLIKTGRVRACKSSRSEKSGIVWNPVPSILENIICQRT